MAHTNSRPQRIHTLSWFLVTAVNAISRSCPKSPTQLESQINLDYTYFLLEIILFELNISINGKKIINI